MSKKKKIIFGVLWLLSLPLVLILGTIYSYYNDFYLGIDENLNFGFMVLLVYFLISVIIGFLIWCGNFKRQAVISSGKISTQISSEEIRTQIRELENEKQINYARLYKMYIDIKSANVPTNAKIVSVIKGVPYINLYSGDFYIWKYDDSLNLFPKFEQYKNTIDSLNMNERYFKTITLKLSAIEYFSIMGETYRETKISGGGGGGISVKGAIVGGLLFGGVGAVIGSRNKTEEIQSKTITSDTRETFLNYFDESNNRTAFFLKFSDFQTLNDVIPEKEYNIVCAINSNYIISGDETKSITSKIRELAKLKDDGILTEEEFIAKKQVLLNKI